MAKLQSIFVCQQCAGTFPKWQGKCTECGAWNSLVEDVVEKATSKSKATMKSHSLHISDRVGGYGEVLSFDQIDQGDLQIQKRIHSGYHELNRVLGGGFVPGSLLLFGGEPGIGKSTLLLQSLGKMAEAGISCLYVSGEESGPQVSARAKRLNIKNSDNLKFLATSDLAEVMEAVSKVKPLIVVADSVQTLSSSEIESAAGTVSQVRSVCQKFMDLSKSKGVITLLVGHVTKEGTVAGPRLLEHMVDGVFYFELASASGYRMVRGQKNRFGATHEVSVFEMSQQGLLEVQNPSARFLAERSTEMAGSAVVAHLAGSRPFLTEFQALTQKAFQPYPRRTVQGIDLNRISVLLAVAEKSLEISFSDQDVYCKVASGDRIEEPSADLAVLMALISSFEQRAIPADLILIGEVGLGGELRSVPGIAQRLSEAKTVGIKRAIVPKYQATEAKEISGIEIIPSQTVRDAYRETWVRKDHRNQISNTTQKLTAQKGLEVDKDLGF